MKLSREELEVARHDFSVYVEELGSKGARERVEVVTSAAAWARVYGRHLLDTIAYLQAENHGLASRACAAERERDGLRGTAPGVGT